MQCPVPLPMKASLLSSDTPSDMSKIIISCETGSAPVVLIAVIIVEPASKVSFVYSRVQMRVVGQYNGK